MTEARSNDGVVVGQQRQPERAARRHDQSVRRIPQHADRAHALGRNRRRNRHDGHQTRMARGFEPIGERLAQLEAPKIDQHGHLPEADVGDKRTVVRRKTIEGRERPGAKPLLAA